MKRKSKLTKVNQPPFRKLTAEELDRLTQFFEIMIEIDQQLKREQKEAEAIKTDARPPRSPKA